MSTEQSTPTGRRRAPEERPQQIIDAAFYEFGEHGLAGARLDDIAKRAQIAKGTIYLYFPNKEALFREMVRGTVIDALAKAEAQIESQKSDSATSQLRHSAKNWWFFLRTDRVRVIQRLVHAELGNFPDLMEFYAAEVVTRGRKLVIDIIQRGVELGEFRPVDPLVAARMYAAIWLQHSSWCGNKITFPQLGPDDQVLDEMLDFYLSALRP